MKELVSEIFLDLQLKYDPEFIILYGSVARGDYSDDSDIDIACFCRAIDVSKDVRLFNGRKLDCWIYALKEAVPKKKEFLRFVGGELLIDKSGQGKKFLKEVTDFYSAGPEPLKPDARKHLVEWSINMVQRASGQSVEASYRRTLLLCQLLEVYFELRDHWFLGSKLSFTWLKENDCTAYNLFETAFKEPTNLEALKKLVNVTINADRSD